MWLSGVSFENAAAMSEKSDGGGGNGRLSTRILKYNKVERM